MTRPRRKKDKKDKGARELEKGMEKGAKKLAKKMRKEERHRRRKDDILEPASTEANLPVDGECSAIDELIAHARVDAGSVDAALVGGHLPTMHVATEGESPPPCRTLKQLVAQQDAEGEAALPAPTEPRNPLQQAYDLQAYKLWQDGAGKRRSLPAEPEWDHLPFLARSPSPCRFRTKGTMWPTRLGAWKSRAGGAYLPPTDAPPDVNKVDVTRHGWDDDAADGGITTNAANSPSPEGPARYIFPEQFKRRALAGRRSPSYAPEKEHNSHGLKRSKRSRSRSLSNDSASPRRDKRKSKRKQKSTSSSSRSDRASPIYEPEDSASKREATEA